MRWLKIAMVIGVICGLGAACIGYWHFSQRYVSTDDAYLNANVVQIASRVTGQVLHLYVVNNQYVDKDKLLFELDGAPYKVAVDKAKAQFAVDSANLQNAIVTARRVEALVKTKVLAPQLGDDVSAKLETSKAAIRFDSANLEQAELNLQYTHTYAPTSGWITNMSLREGDAVNANQAVFALISDDEFWLDANFRETDLAKIKPGQRAKVKLDMYANHTFQGWVESISGGSGSAFSLLPPENATGNWVKVTQRVPVRIRILNDDKRFPLRIGTSGTVTIDLQSNVHEHKP